MENLIEKEIEFIQLQLQLYPGREARNLPRARELRARLNELHRLKQANNRPDAQNSSANVVKKPVLNAVSNPKTELGSPAVPTPRTGGFALTLKVALGIYLGFLLCLLTLMILFNLGAFPTLG